jgi:hypothetical protein
MGGSIASQGGISLMTIHKSWNMGGAPSTPSPAHSVIFELVPLPSGDSVISVLQSTFPSSPRPPPPITSIKDKPSDMGLKDIMDYCRLLGLPGAKKEEEKINIVCFVSEN